MRLISMNPASCIFCNNYTIFGGRTMVKNEDIKKILDTLEEIYPEAECALTHKSVYQLIVAVALSAQTKMCIRDRYMRHLRLKTKLCNRSSRISSAYYSYSF